MKKLNVIIVLCLICVFGLYFILGNRLKQPQTTFNFEIPKLSKAEIAYYNAAYEFERTRNPVTNTLPTDIKSQELKFVSNIPDKEEYYLNHSGDRTFNQYLEQDWLDYGPDNIAGRVLCIGIDVQNEEIIMAGSASGGLWRSTDGGGSWVKITPPNYIQSIYCIIQDTRPGRTNTWYYGTGELLSTTNRHTTTLPRTIGYGDGIFKSTDNGASWSPLESTQVQYFGQISSPFHGIWNLAIDPTSEEQDIVYAACLGAIMKSIDGGETWESVLGDLNFKAFSTDIIIYPDGTKYAGLGTYSIQEPSQIPSYTGIFKSQNGTDWELITPFEFPDNFRMIKFAQAPSNPDILYILTENPIPDTNPLFAFTASQHTFWKVSKLNDERLWEELTTNLPGKGRGDILPGFYHPLHGYNSIGGYAMVFKVHPEKDSVIFLGGTNLYRNESAFYDSLTTRVIGGYPYDYRTDNLHPDQHAIAFNPNNASEIYIGCDAGISKYSNCLADTLLWDYISDGLITTQFYSVSIDHAEPDDNFIIGGVQDNSFFYHIRHFPREEWTQALDGDGLQTYVVDNKEFILLSIYGGMFFSYLVAENDSLYNPQFLTPNFFGIADFNFYTNFALDPVNKKTFYLPAINKLWRKDDIAAATHDTNFINTGWTELQNVDLNELESITSITACRNPAKRLYYGTNAGRIFKMDNANTGQPVPEDITGDSFPANGFLNCIEVDADDGDNIFVVFSNYYVTSIFHSENGGTNWTAVSGNLDEDLNSTGIGPSVRWLKMVKYDESVAYFAATSAGLYSTIMLDGENTVWVREGTNIIGSVIVDNIDARNSDGFIVIATQGNGVYATNYKASAIDDDQNTNRFELMQNYPNPASSSTTIGYTIPEKSLVKLVLLDINGKIVKNLIEEIGYPGKHEITLNTSDLSQGIYFYRLSANNQVITKKISILH